MTEETTVDPTARAVQRIMSIPQEQFEFFIETLDTGRVPTSQTELEVMISGGLPSDMDGETIAAFALAFAGNLYWSNLSPDRTLRRMAEVTGEQLGFEVDAVADRLRALFRSRAVLLVAGAQAGRRHTAGLVERLSLQMDLRPVVHPDGGKVDLYSIYHRLHVVVTDDDAGAVEKTVEIVLDHVDMRQLHRAATAALRAQKEIETSLVESGASVYLPMRKEK